MTYNQYYICHHGILGQKWGKKNGPPYPLDYSKLSPEERYEAKKKAIESGNVKEANSNIDYFSNKDIQDLLDRFDMKRKVKSIAEKDIKTGKQKLEEIINVTGLIAKASENGIRIYNSTAKVSNSVLGTDLPVITDHRNKNNKNSAGSKDVLNTINNINRTRAEVKKEEIRNRNRNNNNYKNNNYKNNKGKP